MTGKDTKVYYVYIHKNPETGRTFYVGKGKGRRAFDRKNRNRHWLFYTKKYGFDPLIISKEMSEPCALTMERIIISIIGIDNLCNVASGGSGNSGWSHSEESRERISAFQRSKIPHPASLLALRNGRPHKVTQDARDKMSIAKKGIPRGPMPESTRDKISKSHVGIKPSPESREKMRLAKLGMRKREENNKFDPTVRVFHHNEYGAFIGCSYDLRTKYNISPACIRSIITGRQKTAKGWSYKGERDGSNKNN